MLPIITALRRTLHDYAELSGQEDATRKILMEFLQEHTSLEVFETGGGILAAHREGDFPTLAFRADFDAIPGPCGKPYHGCGHDGHSAILAGLALMLEGKRLGRNILLLFQSAEETGAGALPLCEAVNQREKIDAVFGFHNIPGYPLGRVLMHEGCFACASRGLIISAKGTQSHAAYPGLGKNPVPLLGRLAAELDKLVESVPAKGLLMATIVGLNAGGRNFGVSAGDGELCLTLRAHHAEDIDALEATIRAYLREHGAEFEIGYETVDAFPDTQNNSAVFARAQEVLRQADIPMQELCEPMRWSEDFGHFTKAFPGMYFGIGIGEGHAGLHTPDYEFDDALLEPAINVLHTLASEY